MGAGEKFSSLMGLVLLWGLTALSLFVIYLTSPSMVNHEKKEADTKK